VYQAGAGRRVVAVERENRVAERQPEHDAAVTHRNVGVPVGVYPIRAVAEFGMLDRAEEVDRYRVQLSCHGPCPPPADPARWPDPWYQLARFAAASSTTLKASSGPLSSELGPGPCPNSMHWPVEMTPMVR
jgi:hypothetical protein